MDKVTGNYLTQSNKDFPLDCETLDALQTNLALLSVLGNIAGDKVILRGCELSQNGAIRSEGYVFLRTAAFPAGEILRFEGGAVGSGMYVKLEDVSVTAQGYEYPKAYTRRTLAAGVGNENFKWADFKDVPTNVALLQAIGDLQDEIDGLSAKFAPAPLGIVQLWAGSTVPDGYALCDGNQLNTKDYPALYKALGTTFNNAYSANGTRYTTTSGYFRLPDLRGRFVVGYHDSDNDYKTKGTAGGEKKHALTTDEMPSHTHTFKDYYYPEAHDGLNYDTIVTNNKIGSSKTDYDNNHLFYYRHDTESKGGDAQHENRPPYYVLAYIMRVK